jgi:signal transduction histidine kinase
MLEQRTRELAEAREQQTATSEILRVISNSPDDVQPVFDTIASSAAKLCEAYDIIVFRVEGDNLRLVAHYGPMATGDVPIVHGTLGGRTVLEQRVIQVENLQTAVDDFPEGSAIARRRGHRTTLSVPLVREGVAIGNIQARRTVVRPYVVRPYTDSQVNLLKTFADQAVIAIENARLIREIEDKSDELAQASQHKSQFLANMSHELRTPLNAILGYTELISDEIYGPVPESIREVLGRVEHNGRHLLDLINSVLDISKIESGRLTLNLAEFSLRDLIHETVVAVEPLATEKGLTVTVEVPTDLPSGHADAPRIRQVLLNLLGNAIKFTETGKVTLQARVHDDDFDVRVTDTGPGIAPADRQRIFDEFQQIDNSSTREKGGTGLGLAISRRIMHLHGGEMGVESVLGEGSVFWLRLPVTVDRQRELT